MDFDPRADTENILVQGSACLVLCMADHGKDH
eukprot:CAMPEP_0203950738 /NCGR_PEP_ID=MMETSP0359-20131031/84787_1 /ASSEMBLY_ACC=CAM_ASM_000338 /TAXON_ID=268821 /ORGANISM="Scrippsiella Hangoei, Strain SHTV-5" /LENGTH=31 /DNA_ID= /DNA_START= /DNA_END= /DNA_ORIENTATION=